MLIAVFALSLSLRTEDAVEDSTAEVAAAPAQTAADVAVESAEMKEEIADRTDELLGMPAGLFDLEYDGAGNLIRLKIKGEAEVSTTLRGSRGDRQAREKAGRDARAAFSKFLNEQIVMMETEGRAS